jgi:hypothetical protein
LPAAEGKARLQAPERPDRLRDPGSRGAMGFSQAASPDLRLIERLPLELLILPRAGNGPLAPGFRARLRDANAPSNGTGHSIRLLC